MDRHLPKIAWVFCYLLVAGVIIQTVRYEILSDEYEKLNRSYQELTNKYDPLIQAERAKASQTQELARQQVEAEVRSIVYSEDFSANNPSKVMILYKDKWGRPGGPSRFINTADMSWRQFANNVPDPNNFELKIILYLLEAASRNLVGRDACGGAYQHLDALLNQTTRSEGWVKIEGQLRDYWIKAGCYLPKKY